MSNQQINTVSKPYTSDKFNVSKLKVWFIYKVDDENIEGKYNVCSNTFALNTSINLNDNDQIELKFGQFISSNWFSHMVSDYTNLDKITFYTVITDKDETSNLICKLLKETYNIRTVFKVVHTFILTKPLFMASAMNTNDFEKHTRMYIKSEEDSTQLSLYVTKLDSNYKFIISTPSIEYNNDE